MQTVPDEKRMRAWTLDQLAKSAFFHRKLHEWKLIEVAIQIELVRGEELEWHDLNISEQAWNKVIHHGIKPVLVFAHPDALWKIPGSAGYYRMLAMVSQKSMKRVGLNLDSYETGRAVPGELIANAIARHLNQIVSSLIEADEAINEQEFDLWRGMAAGSQAQGSWQNKKGSSAEIVIRELILRRLQARGLSTDQDADKMDFQLGGGRRLVFASDPDIAVYQGNVPQVAVEVKGGIDSAGVLERIGAALKSLRRIRQENAASVTILILQEVSMTEQAKADLSLNVAVVDHQFSAEGIVEDEVERERFFQLLGI